MKSVILPKQKEHGKLSIVRPGDQAQELAVSRQLAAQEDFLRASSSTRATPAVCICEWNGVSQEGFVPQPSGRVLSSMGRFSRGRKLLSLEEILYLSEAHALTVLRKSNDSASSGKTLTPMTRTEVFSSVMEAGLSQNVYMVYAHLKRLGYTLRRHFDRPEVCNSDSEKSLCSTPKETVQEKNVPSTTTTTTTDSCEDHLCRQWWSNPFGPVPAEYSSVKVRVLSPPTLINLSSRYNPLPSETFTRVIDRNTNLLACYDVIRPGRRPNATPDMYVVVATALPSPNILQALERCARGRNVRIACCTDYGGLTFYSSEAYVAFP